VSLSWYMSSILGGGGANLFAAAFTSSTYGDAGAAETGNGTGDLLIGMEWYNDGRGVGGYLVSAFSASPIYGWGVLEQAPGQVRFFLTTGSGTSNNIYADDPISIGWHTVHVYKPDGVASTPSIWIDGALVATTATGTPAGTLATSGRNLQITARTDGNAIGQAILKNVRIREGVSSVPSGAAIEADYNIGRDGDHSTSPLNWQHLWQFNDATQTATVPDAIGSNDVTIGGGTLDYVASDAFDGLGYTASYNPQFVYLMDGDLTDSSPEGQVALVSPTGVFNAEGGRQMFASERYESDADIGAIYGDMTVQFTLNMPSLGGKNITIAGSSQGGLSTWTVWLRDTFLGSGSLQMFWTENLNNGRFVGSGGLLLTGRHHYTLRRVGTATVTIFRDGVEVFEGSASGIRTTPYVQEVLGHAASNPGQPASPLLGNGWMGNLKLVPYGLTDAQIAADAALALASF
jgi:hypothetical protein